jgi:hypothetical protein
MLFNPNTHSIHEYVAILTIGLFSENVCYQKLIQTTVFKVVTICSIAGGYQHFKQTCRLLLQGQSEGG